MKCLWKWTSLDVRKRVLSMSDVVERFTGDIILEWYGYTLGWQIVRTEQHKNDYRDVDIVIHEIQYLIHSRAIFLSFSLNSLSSALVRRNCRRWNLGEGKGVCVFGILKGCGTGVEVLEGGLGGGNAVSSSSSSSSSISRADSDWLLISSPISISRLAYHFRLTISQSSITLILSFPGPRATELLRRPDPVDFISDTGTISSSRSVRVSWSDSGGVEVKTIRRDFDR